jgi:hypothetical protein
MMSLELFTPRATNRSVNPLVTGSSFFLREDVDADDGDRDGAALSARKKDVPLRPRI